MARLVGCLTCKGAQHIWEVSTRTVFCKACSMAIKHETGVAVVLGANRGIGLQVRQPLGSCNLLG